MTHLTKTETAHYLQTHDRFAIVTHRRPDGDTIGSAAVLCRGLRQLGKTAHILENPEITEKYIHLHAGLTKPAAAPEDLIVCVDVASANMLPDAFAQYREQIALRIDHHGTATDFTPLALVDPQAAACGELVYAVLTQMGVRLDAPMANALYTAVSTDTGCFRYANTTADTLRTAAACAEVSKELFRINQELFETNSLARLRLQGWLVEHALFLSEGKIVICALPASVEKEMGLTEDDMENISGFPRTIAGVKIAATLREEEGGRIKLSVRAHPDHDAAAVCAKFGGGGHKGAAGASMHCTMEEAVNAVIAALPQI